MIKEAFGLGRLRINRFIKASAFIVAAGEEGTLLSIFQRRRRNTSLSPGPRVKKVEEGTLDSPQQAEETAVYLSGKIINVGMVGPNWDLAPYLEA